MKSVTDWILESDYNEILINRDPANPPNGIKVVARNKDYYMISHFNSNLCKNTPDGIYSAMDLAVEHIQKKESEEKHG